jgi:imidazoleglycerol-phosphate dehydratase
METADRVLQQIIQLQKDKNYSDQQMADMLGGSRPLYQRTRTGRISMGGTFLKGAMKVLEGLAKSGRNASVTRNTRETNIMLDLNIDGRGNWEINTGTKMFDHLLSLMTKHGVFDLKLSANGDDMHHIIEDVAICLGKAFNDALGDKKGIVRVASFSVPMDETLATVVVDIGGRGYPVIKADFSGNDMAGFPSDMVRHFLETLAMEARINLHAAVNYGTNDHHKAEALFKALGRALDAATKIDERIAGELPSTKGYIERSETGREETAPGTPVTYRARGGGAAGKLSYKDGYMPAGQWLDMSEGLRPVPDNQEAAGRSLNAATKISERKAKPIAEAAAEQG